MEQDLIREFVTVGHFNLDRVKALLAEHPTLLNTPFYWSEADPETALDAAGHVGNRPIAEYLLAQGAPLTFYVACMMGMTGRVTADLAENPALAAKPGVHSISALFHAAMSGDTVLAALLAAHGGVTAETANHALHGAVAHNRIEMVRWLLANGVTDINSGNFENKTPLTVATERGYIELQALLREHGAQ